MATRALAGFQQEHGVGVAGCMVTTVKELPLHDRGHQIAS
jgi:hypothetical protein